MRSWFKNLWSAIKDSLWFLPSVFTIVAAALAFILIAVERQGLLWSGQAPSWLYQGDAEGARTVLNVITGSLITVTGVIFSVTIVAVQLASSQYTPRVLRDFSSDRGNQVVFGTLIATFTYAVLVLRTVRSDGGLGEAFVPRLAVTGATALMIVSVVALIYFVNHIAREIHVTAILDRAARETMDNVRQLFPEHIGHPDKNPPPDPRDPEHEAVTVCAAQAGYVQIVDQDNLFDLGEQEQISIAMEPDIGDYVIQGGALASVRMEGRLTEELEHAIRKAFVLGPERTPQQDVEFGMVQMSDIAIKALSPSINDPTTAIRCIDNLAEVLTELGTRESPVAHRTRDGRVCFVANYTTFEQAIKVAYDDIRHFGASIPVIAEHLLHQLAEIGSLVPDECRGPIVDQARAVLHSAREKITNPRDCAAIDRVAERFAERLGCDLDAEEPESS